MPRGMSRCPYCGSLIPNSYMAAHGRVCLVRRAGQGDAMAAARLEIKRLKGQATIRPAHGQTGLEAFIGQLIKKRSR